VASQIRPSFWRGSVGEIVANVLLFVPAGALLHSAGQRSSTGSRVLTWIVCPALLISLAIESIQVFVPRRDATLLDIAANSVGAWCGAFSHRLWGAWRDRGGTAAPRGLSKAFVVSGLTIFAIAALVLSAVLQREARLLAWNPSFPLQIGNERTGDRPWRGRVFGFELADAAIAPESLARFAAGHTVNLPGTVLARFAFRGNAPYRDGAGHLPELAWTGTPVHAAQDVAHMPGRPWLQTAGPVPLIAEQVSESNSFSVRIICATDDIGQLGPARILSNSPDSTQRNLMIGQQERDLIVRVRTAHSGVRGTPPEFVVADVFSDLEPRDILIAYDGGVLRAAVAGAGRVQQMPMSPGPILARSTISLDIETDEHQVLDILYVALLFLVPGVIIGLAKLSPGDRLILGWTWTVVFAVLFETTLLLASGRSFSWLTLATTLTVGVAIVTLFVAARPDNPHGSFILQK
jgi:VanZ like family